jgi:hypothetical protein
LNTREFATSDRLPAHPKLPDPSKVRCVILPVPVMILIATDHQFMPIETLTNVIVLGITSSMTFVSFLLFYVYKNDP